MDWGPPGSSVHRISLGKNTGVGYHFLLQGIFPTQGLNLDLLHCRQMLPSEAPGKPMHSVWCTANSFFCPCCFLWLQCFLPLVYLAQFYPSLLTFTIFQSLLKLRSIESLMPSNYLILCGPFLPLPSIFPRIRVLCNESTLSTDGQSIGASASVLPVNI